jgi:hypothetical protein
MPTVAREKGCEFIVHTRELPFEPPHVHVRFGDDEVRIELNGGTFMEEPPTGRRRAILQAYARHAEAIRLTWARLHEGKR